MKVLVVYYSRTGHTRRVAHAIAHYGGDWDYEPLVETVDRSGVRGWVRTLVDATLVRPSDLLPTRRDPADYELVVVGAPVWAGHVATPVRSWLLAHRRRLPPLALFCTLHRGEGEPAIAEMARLAERRPVAHSVITTPLIRTGLYLTEAARLVDALLAQPRPLVVPPPRSSAPHALA